MNSTNMYLPWLQVGVTRGYIGLFDCSGAVEFDSEEELPKKQTVGIFRHA